MLSQTMLFSFPFVFVGLSLDLLILTYLLMGMTNKENFDGSSVRPGNSTRGDDYGGRNESFWQSKCPSFVHEINEQAILQTFI